MSSVGLNTRTSNYQADPVGKPNLGNMDADMVKLYGNDALLKDAIDALSRDDDTMKDGFAQVRHLSQGLIDYIQANGGGGTISGGGTIGVDVTGEPYNAVGDGVADDTAAIQAAYDAAKVARTNLIIPAGTYKLTSQITLLNTNAAVGEIFIPSIIGVGSVVIYQSNAAAWTFFLRGSNPGLAPSIDLNNWEMSNIKIFAKNGITFNDVTVVGPEFGSDGSGLCPILGATFRNVVIAGTYGAGVDPNYRTNVVATNDELAGYGIGLRLCKCFDVKVYGGWWYGLGIAAALYGTDISNFNGVRFQSNARHFYNKGIGINYGSQAKLDHCDIIDHWRPYGIYNDRAGSFMSAFCFYENTDARTFIYEDRSYASTYLNNRINDLPNETQPWCILDPEETVKFHSNRWIGNGMYPECRLLTSYFNFERPLRVEFIGNDAVMPISTTPGARSAPLNPYLFSGANYEALQGGITASYPWEQDGTRWVVKDNGVISLVPKMTLPILPDRFIVRITAKCRTTTPAGGINLQWVWAGGTFPADAITIFNGGLFFTSNTVYQTRDYLFDAPANPLNKEGGFMIVTLTNNELKIASLEIIPYEDAPSVRRVPRVDRPDIGKSIQAPTRFQGDSGADLVTFTPPSDNEVPFVFSNPTCPDMSFIGRNNPSGGTPTFTFGWHIPIHAGSAYRSGYIGANGNGLTYDSATQNDMEIGAVGVIRFGVWSANMRTTAGATFDENARVTAGGRWIFGEPGDADPGGGKVVIYGGLEMYTGDITTRTIGKGLRVQGGSNAKVGNGQVLVAGTKVVANTSVTANSVVLLTRTTSGGTPGHVSVSISAGVSFTITSSSGTDTSTFSYVIVEEV